MFRKKYFIVSILLLSVFMVACKKEATPKTPATPIETSTKSLSDKTNPVVTIEMEDGAKIKIELYPSVAPNTVNNFISLVQKGYYNGVTFHRVIPDFMIQGGDPTATGTGGPGYVIKGEFTENGFTNNLKHTRGVISMARSPLPNSAGAQFFIVVKDSANNSAALDGKYASFGKVIEGMEEVDKIVKVERNKSDKPLKAQKMKIVTVDTLGVKYEDVIKGK
jgi:peptidyl-prolyl cis-trans isomerase B (cyclophilin B)